MSPDSVVGTAVGLRAGGPRNRGSIAGRGKRFFCRSKKCPKLLWDETMLRICGRGAGVGLDVGIKRPRRETDHPPPSSARVTEWSYTTTLQYALTLCTATTLHYLLYLVL